MKNILIQIQMIKTNYVFGVMIAKKNLCELDFENDTEHNYILYTDIMPDDKFKIIMKEKLDKLKSLIDRYENFFPNGKGILKYLIKTYNRNFMNYNLYYNEKIINYQICVNMLFNNKDDFNNNLFELYEESLAKIENISLYKNILNTKGTNRVSAKHIIKKFEKKQIILPLFKQRQDEKIKSDIYFCFFTNYFQGKILFIYNISKTMICQIKLNLFGEYDIINYKNNIVIMYNSSVFNIIFFSDDYKTYQILELYISYFNQNIHNLYPGNHIMEYYFETVVKLLKTSSNKFIFLYKDKAYIINLGNYLDENKKTDSTSAKENLNLLIKNTNYILNANCIYYKHNNDILEGIILIYFSIEKSKLEIIMLDENLKNNLDMEFKYNLPAGKTIAVFDINYNYLNNIISLFINSEIYILNPATKQIATIYDISLYIKKPANISTTFYYYIDTVNISSFYYYNEENKEMEQAALLMNNYTNEIYQFFWDGKAILLKKRYNPMKNNIKIIPIISPYVLDNLNNRKNDNEINNVKNFVEGIIRIDSDKLVLIW